MKPSIKQRWTRDAVSSRQYRYAKAWQRVNRSPRLRPHAAILLGDGYASDEDHLRWVVSARVGEIEAWAQQIKEDSDG